MKVKNYLKMCVIEFSWFILIFFLYNRIQSDFFKTMLYVPIFTATLFCFVSKVGFVNGLIIFISKMFILGISESFLDMIGRVGFLNEATITVFILSVSLLQLVAGTMCYANTYFLGNVLVNIKEKIHKKK